MEGSLVVCQCTNIKLIQAGVPGNMLPDSPSSSYPVKTKLHAGCICLLCMWCVLCCTGSGDLNFPTGIWCKCMFLCIKTHLIKREENGLWGCMPPRYASLPGGEGGILTGPVKGGSWGAAVRMVCMALGKGCCQRRGSIVYVVLAKQIWSVIHRITTTVFHSHHTKTQ